MLAVLPAPPPPAPSIRGIDAGISQSLFSSSTMDSIGSALQQLLSAPVEFVEGSSSGVLAVPEGKYKPINVIPTDLVPPEPLGNKNISSPARRELGLTEALYSEPILLRHPPEIRLHGCGLLNIGNTCFINSVLQCLLHLPPLLHVLNGHTRSECPVSQGFCATCKLRDLKQRVYERSKRHILPDAIVNNLGKIGKHFRHGRQEDAHEFLRYLIEAMQKSCLFGLGAKVDPKLAETSWVHHVFGGGLRSRVKCRECGHPSDTQDSILDLSIDVHGVSSVKEALHKFVKLDVLKGADCYKCEKCSRTVIAEKGFTLHRPPKVLTIHLKRFTPFGRKLTNPVRYDERLDMQPFMSEGQFGPTYTLYGVINHAGSGPNSGHYYSFVRSKTGRWFEMNDEMVESRSNAHADKSAYVLFYMQEQGETLRQFTATPRPTAINGYGVNALSTVNRQIPAEDDIGVPATVVLPQHGAVAPSAESRTALSKDQSSMPHLNPQSDMLARKISAFQSKEQSTPNGHFAHSVSPIKPLNGVVVPRGNTDATDDISAVDTTSPLPISPSVPSHSSHAQKPDTIDIGSDSSLTFGQALEMKPAAMKRKASPAIPENDSNPDVSLSFKKKRISSPVEARSGSGSTSLVSNPFSGRGKWDSKHSKGISSPLTASSAGALRKPGVKDRMKKRRPII